MQLSKRQIEDEFVELSGAAGFDEAGIVTDVSIPVEVRRQVEGWVKQGMAGHMKWFQQSLPVRLNPQKYFPPVKSAFVLLHSYYHPDKEHWQRDGKFKVAHYAASKDYHKVLRKKSHQLVKQLQERIGTFQYRVSVDSSPVLERFYAVRAGLGWIGKNSMHISPRIGSYHFIVVIFTNLHLSAGENREFDYCGTCSKCIDACPTGAILPNRTVNSNKCISYLTIEHKAPIPEELKSRVPPWVFGCDECISVCPWNNKKTITTESRFWNQINEDEIKNLLMDYSDTKFNEVFAGTPVRRAGAEHFKYVVNLGSSWRNFNE